MNAGLPCGGDYGGKGHDGVIDGLSHWPAFSDAVRARLELGRSAYGDSSFTRPPAELVGEIEQELLDVCGWSFVLFERLRRLRGESSAENISRAPATTPSEIPPAGAEAPRLVLELTASEIAMLEECGKRIGLPPGAVFRVGLVLLHRMLTGNPAALKPKTRRRRTQPGALPAGKPNGGNDVRGD